MISSRDLETLLAWKPPEGHSILSLYLDRKATRGVWNAAESVQLARSILKDLQEKVDRKERPDFEAVSRATLSRLAAGSWSGRSLVAFSGSNGNSYWARELKVPLSSQARWGPTPYLRPLIEAVEEYERFGVVLTDKSRARLFTIFLGEIEEERDAFNPEPAKHVSSTGTDQIRTDTQSRSNQHARWHLKHVAGMLDRMERQRRFDRLVLGGPAEDVSALRRLLPKRLASRIVGVVSLPIEASEADVLRETLGIERQAQRLRNEESVAELEAAAAKKDRAVAGLDATLEALQEGRVWKLLYVENLAFPGRECGECGSLLPASAARCLYCNAATRPAEDLIEKMAERVAESGGRVLPMGNTAGERLKKIGEIGAFLRFKQW